MIESLQNLIHRALQRVGLDLKRYVPANDPHLRRQTILKHHGIDLVVDGGANSGQYGTKLRENGYRERILSLEPSAEAYGRLRSVAAKTPPWDCHRLALGRAPGTATLHVAENSVSSSLLPATSALEVLPGGKTVSTETVEVTTLDEFAAEHIPSSAVVLVKLDVQGSELAALEGGPKLLSRARLVELELAWTQFYGGQSPALDLLGWLDRAGYDVVSMTPNTLDPTSGHVLECDALLARRHPRT